MRERDFSDQQIRIRCRRRRVHAGERATDRTVSQKDGVERSRRDLVIELSSEAVGRAGDVEDADPSSEAWKCAGR